MASAHMDFDRRRKLTADYDTTHGLMLTDGMRMQMVKLTRQQMIEMLCVIDAIDEQIMDCVRTYRIRRRAESM